MPLRRLFCALAALAILAAAVLALVYVFAPFARGATQSAPNPFAPNSPNPQNAQPPLADSPAPQAALSSPGDKSYAIFADFAKANVLMKNGLNRRLFNTTEALHGANITLNPDGSVTLQPGTYRLSGFSAVTMAVTFAPPVPKNNDNYPGYCLLYPKEFESTDTLKHVVCIGSPATALDFGPSLFDCVFTCQAPATLCLGHQSGENLHDEVYLDVYEVAGIPSPFHLFARLAVFQL
jgi:hypothetical protein